MASIAVAALWWLFWGAIYLWILRPGRGLGVLALVAYEGSFVVLVPVLFFVLLVAPESLPDVLGEWPLLGSAVLGGVAGGLVWLGIALASGGVRLYLGAPSRRLLISTGLHGVSAAGEEVVFRWLLLGGVISIGGDSIISWLVVSGLFGVHHMPVGGWRVAMAHTLTGGIFGLMFLAGGGLIGAVCAHVAFNALASNAREKEMRSRDSVLRRTGLRR